MIELAQKYTKFNDTITDEELRELKTKYPDCNAFLSGIMSKEDFVSTIDNMYDEE